MKKGLLFLVLLLIGFFLFLIIKTLSTESNQINVPPFEDIIQPEGAIERFVEALSYRTISFEDPEDFDSTQFEQFNAFLLNTYPSVFEKCEHTIISDYSHIIKWEGTQQELDPIILMAHIDVVPIANLRAWTVHPFEEGVKDGVIYGRGTIDDKSNLVAIMEAVDALIKEGFQPSRTVYLTFGHDEEILGYNGAAKIASHFEAKGVKAHFVLDEGLTITEGLVPGMNSDRVALVGVAEKGFLSLELTVNSVGGHSSLPERETSIDILSRAVHRLKSNPPKATLTPVIKGFLLKLGTEFGFWQKLAVTNSWLFESLIVKSFTGSAGGNANLRTTVAPTIFEAGIKENIVPTTARAVVNFRIIPGETQEDVIAYVRNTIDDERILIAPLSQGSNPSPISSINTNAYESLEKTIKELFPDVLIAPSLVVGATDSRYFTKVSDNVYRFSPMVLNKANLNCFHGLDERLPVEEYIDIINYYRRLIMNSME